jgi:hypothetical protein
MAIAGIDYSLCGPCVCVFDGETQDVFGIHRCSFYYLTTVKKNARVFDGIIYGEMFDDYNHECQRYETISDWAVDKVLGCNQVGLEGYAYGASGRAIFQIAENCGLLKYKLYQQGKPIEVISPTAVKKFATGKGNASKEMMVKSFGEKTGIDLKKLISPDRTTISNPITDIADSYFICSFLHSTLRQREDEKT